MTDKLKANIKVKNIAHYVETMRQCSTDGQRPRRSRRTT